MEVETKYKQIVKRKLEDYTKSVIANLPDVKTELIIGKNDSHFILLDIGWQDDEFIHEWVFHIEVRDNKVWIHEDMTDVNIAKELIDVGIEQADIRVSFWQTPDERVSSQDAA